MSQVSQDLSQSPTVTPVTALKHRVTLTGLGQRGRVRDTCPGYQFATKCDTGATPVADIDVRQVATIRDGLRYVVKVLAEAIGQCGPSGHLLEQPFVYVQCSTVIPGNQGVAAGLRLRKFGKQRFHPHPNPLPEGEGIPVSTGGAHENDTASGRAHVT